MRTPRRGHEDRSDLTQSRLNDLAGEEAAHFTSLVFNREAYEVLAALVRRVAEAMGSAEPSDAPASRALRRLVDEELVPDVAYDFIRRYGWPHPTEERPVASAESRANGSVLDPEDI